MLLDQGVMWLSGWKLFIVTDPPSMFRCDKHCGSGDRMVLVHHIVH